MCLKEIKSKQGPHKSLCPFPFNDKEVIIGLRYSLPLIPPSQGHLCYSRSSWSPKQRLWQMKDSVLVKESQQCLSPKMNVPPICSKQRVHFALDLWEHILSIFGGNKQTNKNGKKVFTIIAFRILVGWGFWERAPFSLGLCPSFCLFSTLYLLPWGPHPKVVGIWGESHGIGE